MSDNLNVYYLDAMGIETWELRQTKPDCKKSLLTLAQTVAACQQCALHKTRTQTVFARGNPTASLMIIGEAPGFYEDKQGKPFVGKAGQLLDQMLKSIGLSEETVYIANVLKCRPPNNRDPSPEEVTQCSGYLMHQIELIKPRLMLALGRFAAAFLLNHTGPLNPLRQKIHYFATVPFLVSFHPAYLLRNPVDKKKAYEDLLFLQHILNS